MSEKNIPRPNEKATYLTFYVGRDREKFRVKVKDKGLIIGRTTKRKAVDLDTKPMNGDKLGVSRQHVLIGAKKDYFYVQDLESVNSTWLNRVRLKPMVATELYHGDILHLGECRIEVYYTYEDEVHAELDNTKVFDDNPAIDDASAPKDSEKSTRVFGQEDDTQSDEGKTGFLPDLPDNPTDADPSSD